ncbi:MAG: DNA polymerase III subunit [Clostridia bacterium]|nr:DNA polymerase III subunit [Clostridia bacterium]
MRQAFTDVIGNDRLRRILGDDIAAHSLSHAYILEGARGSGKHTVALRIAAALACEHRADSAYPLPCLVCPACRKILSGNSPDIIYINREEKATLGVDAIRFLKSDVYIAPNDTDTKVYIIEEAHLMTSQAQNAFLLTLEEPPAYVLFLLLCESAAPLLETVRSRAQLLRTDPIATDRIGAHLVAQVPEAKRLAASSPTDFEEILAAADGSIGRAISLLDPKLYKPIVTRRQNARKFVELCRQSKNSAQVLRYLLSLPQKREDLIEQCNELLLCLRDLLLLKQTEHAPLCFFSNREEACGMAYAFTTPDLLALCDCVSEAIDRLRQNANVRLVLTDLAASCGLLYAPLRKSSYTV